MEKIWTIEGVADGSVILEKDGSYEDFLKLIKIIFPTDKEHISDATSGFNYFVKGTSEHFQWQILHDFQFQEDQRPVVKVSELLAQVENKDDSLNQKLIRRFKSGAVRSSDLGRLRPDYISPYALEEIAAHFTKAEDSFGSESDSTNYFLGIKPKDVQGSISRHYIDLQKAFHQNDSATIREELRAIASNCIMALHQIRIEELGLYKEIYDKTEYVPATNGEKL